MGLGDIFTMTGSALGGWQIGNAILAKPVDQQMVIGSVAMIVIGLVLVIFRVWRAD